MHSFLLISGIGVAVVGGGAAKIQAQAPLQAVIVVRHAEKAATPKENPPSKNQRSRIIVLPPSLDRDNHLVRSPGQCRLSTHTLSSTLLPAQ